MPFVPAPLTNPDAPSFRRKKFRGNRRHFARALRDADRFRLLPQEKGWGTWHYHADWKGRGNVSWCYRKEYLKAHCMILREIAEQHSIIGVPFQTWILLSGSDTGQDATFLHSPNEYGEKFSIIWPEITWNIQSPLVEAEWKKHLSEYPLQIGKVSGFHEHAEPPRDRASLLLFSPALGLSLDHKA